MMLHLLRIDLKKLTSYRTFWIVCGLYFVTLALTTSSGMEALKWLASKIEDISSSININRIPLYHFPDVWLNLIFSAGLFKIVLGIMVVISITNEFSYRTVRQNIIDGLSRWQFLQSKMLTNVLLSLMSVVMIFIIGLVTGLIYSPQIDMADMFVNTDFFFAYFLEVFAYLSFALLLGMVIRRSGLTIIILLLSNFIEFIAKVKIPESADFVKAFFPMESISNLVTFPFPRYWLQEIQDYVSLQAVAIALFWTFMFNYFSYLRLKKSDI